MVISVMRYLGMTNLMRPDHDVFTQRNNALYPDSTCWPTSVIQALHIRDIKLPEGKYEQPEDNLTNFCMTDKNIQKSWQKHDPERYYKPWQVHIVLCEAINRWVGHDVAEHKVFNGDRDLRRFIDAGRCVVISGRFPYYSGAPINHAICVCGYDNEGYIICDPWGDYKTLYSDGSRCARSNLMPYKDFRDYMKTSCIII